MSRQAAFLQLILSMAIMSSSGPLGRFISLPVPMTIWSRTFLATIALFLFLKLTKQPTAIGWGRDFKINTWSAVLLGAHWITYFLALKYANVAIGMLSMFTYPVITAIIEPLFFGGKFDWKSISLAMLAFLGVYFLVPDFTLANEVTIGILCGLASAVFYAIRNILSSRSVTKHSGVVLMMYQTAVVCFLLLPLWFYYSGNAMIEVMEVEWSSILLLGLFTTAVGHTLLVRSFANFPITTLSTITCLTPLLGIVLGYLFLGESPTPSIYIGGAIIMLSVVVESSRMIKKS